MINSWKEFWLSEQRIFIILCLAGALVGLIIGSAVAGWSEYFPAIEIFNKYQIPALILFGTIVSLATQIVSVWFSWVMLDNESHWNNTCWFLIGLPMGIMVALNIFNGYLVALGFVIPYILDILLTGIVMMFVGWHNMHILWLNAISLLPLYIISTGFIWFIEFSRSLF
jgi:hypothetical protein